jgi:hypothetical protein
VTGRSARFGSLDTTGLEDSRIKTRELPEGKDPVGFVLSVNLHRRHLSTKERATIAATLAKGTRGGDRSKSSNDGLTQEQAAKLLNVSPKSVERAKAMVTKPKPPKQEAPAPSDAVDKLKGKYLTKLTEMVREKREEAEAAAAELVSGRS